MPTECSPTLFDFAPVAGRSVVAAFDGGAITSNAGALLLDATDRAINLVSRFAACFRDARAAERIEHAIPTLIGQRVFGIALGHEDVVDHDQLRRDPVLAVLAGKLEARRADCAPLAGKSTLNRLEHAPVGAPGRYHRIGHDAAAIEASFVDLFSADLVQDRPSDRRRGVARGIGAERGQQARDHASVSTDRALCYATVLAQPLLEQHETDIHVRRLWRCEPLNDPALRQEPDEAAGTTSVLCRNAVAASDTGAAALVVGETAQSWHRQGQWRRPNAGARPRSDAPHRRSRAP